MAEHMEVPASLEPLVASIRELYHSKEFSDLTIKCKTDDSEWKVHKAIVCAQPEVLKKTVLRGAQLEEKEEKDIITLDDDPQVIEAMLNFLYTWTYGDHGNRQEHVAPLVMDVCVFIIADKYFIKPLGDLAADKFSKRCEAEWNDPAFCEAIKEIYTNGPGHNDRLKRIIIEAVERNVAALLDQKSSDDNAGFQAVLREIADFGADVA